MNKQRKAEFSGQLKKNRKTFDSTHNINTSGGLVQYTMYLLSN